MSGFRHVGIALALACAGGDLCAQTLTFTEVAGAAGVDGVYKCAQGYPGMHNLMVGGVAVGDFNNDDWPDLFAPSGGVEADRLYINQRDGTFRDEAQAWGIAQRRRSGGVAVGDVNKDGLDDIFLVSFGDASVDANPFQSRLFLNRMTGGVRTFEEVGQAAGVARVAQVSDGMGACFGDYDLDGDLDLFVSAWFDTPGGNRLFRNEGNDSAGVPRFVDVTELVGLDTEGLRGFTPRFVDMTGDRYPELLLTNDFGTSRYYENSGADPVMFTDRTVEAGVTHDCNGMGSSVGDVDGDGDLDWMMTNIYFPPPVDSCGNTLYLHERDEDGRVTFVERARAVGVLDAGWGWGTELVDLDLDGDLDLLATGGWSSFPGTPARVYLNRSELGAGLVFDEVAGATGLDFIGQGRGLVTLDYDRDGDRDVVIVEGGGAMRLFRNGLDSPGSAVSIDVVTWVNPCLAPGGLGTKIVARAGGRETVRVIDGAQTYLGSSETRVVLGLGAEAAFESIELTFADGSVRVLTDVAGGSEVEVIAWHRGDLDRSGGLDFGDVIEFLGLFAAGDPGADLNADTVLDAGDAIEMVWLLGGACAG